MAEIGRKGGQASHSGGRHGNGQPDKDLAAVSGEEMEQIAGEGSQQTS
jgi:general stress protein YciG